MKRAAVAALVVAGIALPGCTEVESEEVEGYQPAELHDVGGSEFKRVTLTPEGAERSGVRTAVVRRGAVPYSALIYDAEGRTYVYVTPEPRSFVRAPVAIDRIVGAKVMLRDGLPDGTKVVTTGTAEVYGTELEVAGSH